MTDYPQSPSQPGEPQRPPYPQQPPYPDAQGQPQTQPAYYQSAPYSPQPGGQPVPAPMPAQPSYQPPVAPQEPERQHVHHSYIWLGSIQVGVSIFVVMVISMFSAIAGALAEGETLGSDLPTVLLVIGLSFGGLLLIIGIVFLFQWWSYRNLYYELGLEEFNLYSGIFNKKRVHVPYQRIQSVDQRASLLQRIFGVCTVNIDTAGGSTNKAVSVPYVQKSKAEQLRTELFARKQFVTAVQNGMDPVQAAQAVAAASGVMMPQVAPSAPGQPGAPGQPIAPGAPTIPGAPAPATANLPHNVLDAPAEIWQDVRGVFGGAAIDTGQVTYEYGLSNKELVFTGLSNNTALVLIIIGVLGGVAQFAGEIVPLFMGEGNPLVNSVLAWSAQLFGGSLIAAGVAAVLLFVAAAWLLSIIGTLISFGGFRACRRDNRIEVEHGLLQHQHQSVSIDRVQSVMVKQSFIRRLLGYCELSLGKIDAMANSSDEQQKSLTQGLVVHPFVKLNRVPEILAGIIPEFADVPVESTPVAPVALRRALIRRGIIQGTGFWLAVMVAIAQVCCNLFISATGPDAEALALLNMGAYIAYALCVALLVLDLIGAVLWFRGSGFAYNERFMQISNGGFSRETISFPRKKIQYGSTKTNPFQRRAGTATVSARTAAGVGGTTVRLIDARAEDAAAWLDWLKPRTNVIE